MKKLYFLFLMFLISAFALGQDLMISGVFDGPLDYGTPKAIELYVKNDIASLSTYGIGSANNGGGTDGVEFTFPDVSATAGDFIYIATETPFFNTYFGSDPDYTSSSAAGINGDDAIELFLNTVVIDLFGDIDTDGTGEAWEHSNGWAYRTSGSSPSTTFNTSDWIFSGINAVDGCATNATCASKFPIGTFSATGGSGVSNNSVNNVSIYPNPASDMLYFKGGSELTKSVHIYDMLGVKVMSQIIDDNSMSLNLSTGIYLVKIEQGGKVSNQRLIVQ